MHIHDQEQAAITAACDAGVCQHAHCHFDDAKARATAIMRETPSDGTSNERGASQALLALLPNYPDTETGPGDFLSDFMHLCDLAGWDFTVLLDSAILNYLEEVEENGEACDTFLRGLLDG